MDFEIVNSFRMIGVKLPPISYPDHVEVRVLTKEMENIEVSFGDQWETIEKFGKTKYRLHQ